MYIMLLARQAGWGGGCTNAATDVYACPGIQLQALVNNSYALPDVTVLFQFGASTPLLLL
jgi:hypothetical protein